MSAAFGRVRTGCCDQQGLLFAGDLAVGSRVRTLSGPPVADHKAALGPIDGRAAYPDAARDPRHWRRHPQPAKSARAAPAWRWRPAFGLAEFDPMMYVHRCLLLAGGTDEQLNRMAGVSPSAKTFTPTQGQYLAYIHLYTRLHRRPPAEADIQQYFRVAPPSVHQMVLTLERAGFIRRQPGAARSIEVLVDLKLLPELL